MRRFILTTLSLALFLGFVGLGIVVFGIWHLSQGLPEFSQLKDYQPPVTTRVHAGDGRLVAEFATERRVFVPVDAMPKRVVRAFIAAEDQNFYSHGGVDWVAVLRASLAYAGSVIEGRRPGGASTITQQVARHFLLSNEFSFERKFREWILAHRLEQALSKDRILELYLNEIYLGNRAYGVAAAALNYFDKSLDELTLAEAAFLASLPKAPDRYFRERFRDAAIARRNYVIGRMLEDGYITQMEAAEASAEPIAFRDRSETRTVRASYFVEEVRRELQAVYGEKALYGGGLSVRTTLNPELQSIASRVLRDGLERYDRKDGWRGPVTHLASFDSWKDQLRKVPVPPGGEDWTLAVVLEVTDAAASIGTVDGERGRIPLEQLKWARRTEGGKFVAPPVKAASDALNLGDVVLVEKLPPGEGDDRAGSDIYALRQIPEVQGALVAMDPHTGRVLALVGGFSSNISVFNRATQALRQPGSAFKPFVYLAALEQGFTPSSLILDAPFAMDQGAGLGKWRPSNFTDKFYGPTPLRVGMEKSRNVMTVRLAQYMGMEPVVDVVRRFGVVDNLPPHLSMALGAAETTVLRLTAGYAMLVNGGKRITPTFIDRVQDATGRTIYRHDKRPCEGCGSLEWPASAQAAPVDAAVYLASSSSGQTAPTGLDGTAASPSQDSSLAVPSVPDNREQVADPRHVYQIVAMLEGVVQRGTGVRIKEIGKPLAGKTGTTNDANDVWFVGFSPDLAVGVFVGFDQPRSLGDTESGSSIAVPIFKDFMAGALRDAPATPFRVPPGLRLVRVDAETGRLARPGDGRAIWEGFIPGTEPTGNEGVLDGGDQGTAWVPNQGSTPGAQQQPGRPPQTPVIGTGTGGVY